MSKTFSEYAKERLLQLFNSHAHEVGSILKEQDPNAYAGYCATNCITYAINVISYAFEKVGNARGAQQVRGLGEHGTELSRYLVNTHRWSGIYINPDVVHSLDGSREHPYSDFKVGQTCTYYNIPIKYRVINYNPTPSTAANFQKVNQTAPETQFNDVDVNILSTVDFGFGVSRGGKHTWLFSAGYVYEVHWDEIGSKLYERTLFSSFGWLSGAIVVPPDLNGQLTMSHQKCKARQRP